MDAVPFVIAALFLLPILIGGVGVTIARFIQRDAYRNLANRRGGKVTFAGWYGPPVVRFIHDGQAVTVTCGRDVWPNSRPSYTELRLDWPDKDFLCRIRTVQFPDRVSRWFRRPGFQSGHEPFDRRFTISVNDEEQARKALSPHAQVHLLKFLAWKESHRLSLRVEQGVLYVRKRHRYHTRENLRLFVASALSAHELLTFTSMAGIELLESTNRLQEEMVCQICGGQVVDLEAVYCRQCHAPHHPDCWKYAGKCSIYACGATKFLTAKPVA